MQRFAPAESPVRMILLGEMRRLLMTWERRREACCS